MELQRALSASPVGLILTSVSLLLAALTTPSRADQGPYPTWITVDQRNQSAENCHSSALTVRYLVNRTCSDLQDVLLGLADSKTEPQSSNNCIDVIVLEGDYFITENVSISRKNLRLHGEGNVTVHFNFSAKFDPTKTNEPHYVVSFFNTDLVELHGIDFTDSPGIITVFSVTTVVIEKCSFR